MKTDTYTKTILTVIAVCLSINVIQTLDIIPSAQATTNTPETLEVEYHLVPVSPNQVMDVRIVDINTYDEMNINIKGIDTSEELKVNLKSIDTTDELDVNIDEVGGSWVSNGGPIKVKVE
ncbi:MAG: hypothetical protein ACI836_001226 [Saprospiraceae bacterium]|jgi:hypothetical protein